MGARSCPLMTRQRSLPKQQKHSAAALPFQIDHYHGALHAAHRVHPRVVIRKEALRSAATLRRHRTHPKQQAAQVHQAGVNVTAAQQRTHAVDQLRPPRRRVRSLLVRRRAAAPPLLKVLERRSRQPAGHRRQRRVAAAAPNLQKRAVTSRQRCGQARGPVLLRLGQGHRRHGQGHEAQVRQVDIKDHVRRHPGRLPLHFRHD